MRGARAAGRLDCNAFVCHLVFLRVRLQWFIRTDRSGLPENDYVGVLSTLPLRRSIDTGEPVKVGN